jgi:hypothetical protein
VEFKWSPFINYQKDTKTVSSNLNIPADLIAHVKSIDTENMVYESQECLLEAKFPVQSRTRFFTIDSSLILKLMKHDFCTEPVGSEQERHYGFQPTTKDNLEAQ